MTHDGATTYPTATAIAEAVAGGTLSASAVLDAHLARTAASEGTIHAFNHTDDDAARQRANEIDARVSAGEDVGPLAGVPIVIKDNICTKGVPTTCSSRMLDGWIPPYDATVVRKLAAAGAVTVGKANMDEFAMGSSTENSAFGPTLNPRDTTRVPGGSSGGSAASVAAGFAPVALGSDTGGSIRQPAAFCGLVGVKPTYGLVSRLGLIAFGSSLDQIGPLTHTVADAALVLDVISGHDSGDSTSLPTPAPRVSAHLDDGVAGLRVGLVRELMGEGIAPEVLASVNQAAEALVAAGAIVEEVSLPTIDYSLSAYYIIAPAEASSNLSRYDGVRYGLRVDAPTTGEMMERTRTQGFGDEVKRRIMLGTYALSAGYYDAFYGTAQRVRAVIRGDFDAVYNNVDVLLTPTTPTTAFKLAEKVSDPMAMYMNDICTIASNLVGQPSMSVPFGLDSDGLPIGVQLMAPTLGETTMFAAAAVLEAAQPLGSQLGSPRTLVANEGGL